MDVEVAYSGFMILEEGITEGIQIGMHSIFNVNYRAKVTSFQPSFQRRTKNKNSNYLTFVQEFVKEINKLDEGLCIHEYTYCN